MDVGLVCDDCRAFNAMGARACVRCGVDLSLEPGSRPTPELSAATIPLAPPSAPIASPPGPGASVRDCTTCGNPVPTGNRFCGACGASMPEETRTGIIARGPAAPSAHRPEVGGGGKKTMFFGAMQAARAKLVVIKGDGLDGVSFTLAGADHQAGRIDVPILFEDDGFLSPLHANFFYKNGKLVVRDEASVNGVYIRIRGAVPFGFDDRFLVGEQVIQVERTLRDDPAGEVDADGTYFYASPRPASHFRLVQLLRGGDSGLSFQAQSDVVSLGREGNDINFPDDPFISGHHAQVSYENGALNLTDLGSKNGTFLRITADTVLEHGDYVFMGQQLLRVEIV